MKPTRKIVQVHHIGPVMSSTVAAYDRQLCDLVLDCGHRVEKVWMCWLDRDGPANDLKQLDGKTWPCPHCPPVRRLPDLDFGLFAMVAGGLVVLALLVALAYSLMTR